MHVFLKKEQNRDPRAAESQMADFRLAAPPAASNVVLCKAVSVRRRLGVSATHSFPGELQGPGTRSDSPNPAQLPLKGPGVLLLGLCSRVAARARFRSAGCPLEYSVCLQTDCGTPDRPHTCPGARASLCFTLQGRKEASHTDPGCFGVPRSRPDRYDCDFSLLLPVEETQGSALRGHKNKPVKAGGHLKEEPWPWPRSPQRSGKRRGPFAMHLPAASQRPVSHGVVPSLAREIPGQALRRLCRQD
ncbi:uncharacterized protein LOC126016021 [Suncus etruscus]|uniref:uncharacterized protein LOC126016021 n=1 Tax=Suncus etruscus TaxID=109475 RepID=UPI00210FB1E4|nr:uncharacterized protein LOC126016021 [Suncus etruscus]